MRGTKLGKGSHHVGHAITYRFMTDLREKRNSEKRFIMSATLLPTDISWSNEKNEIRKSVSSCQPRFYLCADAIFDRYFKEQREKRNSEKRLIMSATLLPMR